MTTAYRQEPPAETTEAPKTTNYRSQIGDFSNANWGLIVACGFGLLLLVLIRRAFRR